MKHFCLILVLAFGLTVVAQERPAVSPRENAVFVGADGKFEAVPDTAFLQFTIAAQESSSDAAYAKAAAAAERMRQALRANGVDPKTAELGHYSLQPMYDYRTPKRKIVGYRVTSSVTLKLKDFTKVGPLTQALSAIEETENQSINYTLENIEAAKQKAVEDAFQKAKSSAATVAKAGGRTLGDLSYASVDTFEQVHPPVPMMTMRAQVADMKQEAVTAEFSPQKVTVTAHVNAMFNLK
jgi:uncharacterized protein